MSAVAALSAAPTVSAADSRAFTRDVDCIAAAVYYEARGESPAGQAAVAQVVLNRAHKAGFPKSVCGVIYQGSQGRACQFSFVCSGAMAGSRDPAAWSRAQKVALRALDGYVMSEVGGATSFHAARLGSRSDGRMSRIARVGAHVFLVNATTSPARPSGPPALRPGPATPASDPPAPGATPTALAAS